MHPIRKNFYNQEIFMVHQEELLHLIDNTDNPLLREHINMLRRQYDWEKNYLEDIPYELRSWPNYYIGLSINDEGSRSIIELAMQVRMDEYVYMDQGDLSYACGVAFMEGQYELAGEIAKTKEIFLPSNSAIVKDILQVVTEDTLNYLLTYAQTKGCVTNDSRIVFYNGERYIVLDTILSPFSPKSTNDTIFSNAPVNHRTRLFYKNE